MQYKPGVKNHKTKKPGFQEKPYHKIACSTIIRRLPKGQLRKNLKRS